MILQYQPEVKFADCAPSLQQGMPQQMAKFPYLRDPHQTLADTSPVVFVHVVWIE